MPGYNDEEYQKRRGCGEEYPEFELDHGMCESCINDYWDKLESEDEDD